MSLISRVVGPIFNILVNLTSCSAEGLYNRLQRRGFVAGPGRYLVNVCGSLRRGFKEDETILLGKLFTFFVRHLPSVVQN